MNTRMHQEAFPGEDISDRPPPEASVPGLLALIEGDRRAAATRAGRCWSAARRALAFTLPPAARAAAARRAAARDDRRLMVAPRGEPARPRRASATCRATCAPGDLLVVNASATMPAALRGASRRGDGRRPLDLHACRGRRRAPRRRALDRRAAPRRAAAHRGRAGERLPPSRRPRPPSWSRRTSRPAGCGSPRSTCPPRCSSTSPRTARRSATRTSPSRAARRPPDDLRREPGSAEMPSAGRPFTPRVLDGCGARRPRRAARPPHRRLVARARRAAVPRAVPRARPRPPPRERRAPRRRVIAVGTTVSARWRPSPPPDGTVRPARGWTALVITPERGVRAVDGLLTGWHEPDASHLLMLEAVAGRELVERSYAAALAAGYRWHEFGEPLSIMGWTRAASRPGGGNFTIRPTSFASPVASSRLIRSSATPAGCCRRCRDRSRSRPRPARGGCRWKARAIWSPGFVVRSWRESPPVPSGACAIRRAHR